MAAITLLCYIDIVHTYVQSLKFIITGLWRHFI